MANNKEFHRPINLQNFLEGERGKPTCPIHFNDPFWYQRLTQVFDYIKALEEDVRTYVKENSDLARDISRQNRRIEELETELESARAPRAKKKAAKKKAVIRKANYDNEETFSDSDLRG